MTIGIDIAVVLAGIAGIVWLVRLEGRINLSDRLITAIEKRMEGLEVRIINELRDLRNDVRSLSDKIDNKEDKE